MRILSKIPKFYKIIGLAENGLIKELLRFIIIRNDLIN